MRDLIDIIELAMIAENNHAPLYHFSEALVPILESNLINLGVNGTVSLTRSTDHEFFGDALAVFVLDQGNLRTKYKLHTHSGDINGGQEMEEFTVKPIQFLDRYLIGISIQASSYKRGDQTGVFGISVKELDRLIDTYRQKGVKISCHDRNMRSDNLLTSQKNQTWFKDFR